MGVGAFSPTDLTKALAGKVSSLRPSISNYSSGFSGSSSKKDIEVLFQLLNLYVLEPRKDSALFNAVLQRGRAQVSMLGANPQVAFIDTLNRVMYNDNPLAPSAVPKAAHFDKINLGRSMAIYKELLGDLGGMHITIVGSFDEKEIIALLEKYVAGLPAVTKPVAVDNKVRIAKGQQTFQVRKGKEDKCLIVGIFAGEVPYSEALALKLNGLSDALNIIITEEMREKIQGIYGGGTNAGVNKIPYGAYQMILQLPCGPAKVDTLISSFNSELKRIAEKKIDQSYAEKVKKAWIEKYKVDVKTNAFWLSALQDIARGERTTDRVINAERYYNALSLQDLSDAAQLISKSASRIMAIQMPELAGTIK